MRNKLSLLIVALGSFSHHAAAGTLSPSPFSIKHLNPFTHVYGIPATEPAELIQGKRWGSTISLDIANNSIVTHRGDEDIYLDGETYRLAATLRRGLGNNSEIGFEIPLLAHSRGWMDNLIEEWHNLLGLSNAQRNKTPNNTLRYEYFINDTKQAGVETPSDGIGDISVFVARQLGKTTNSALSLHTRLKLPTGDAQQLHGSGAADLSVSLAHIKRHWLTSIDLSTFVNGGLSFLGKGDVLPDIQKRLAGFGSAGLIWDNGKKIDLKLQFDFHSSVYHSELDQLGNGALQLTLGGTIHFNRATRLDIGVGENLVSDTTPDLMINVALKHRH